MNDDALSLSMFWAGLLMVFTPLIFAGTVIGVAWRQRRRSEGGGKEESERRRAHSA
jgi:hypothetical protein